jgi:hypothetical protein
VPRLHACDGAQSVSAAQGATLQAVPAQAQGEQLVDAPGMQVPTPLQVEAAARFCFPLQITGAHIVPEA